MANTKKVTRTTSSNDKASNEASNKVQVSTYNVENITNNQDMNEFLNLIDSVNLQYVMIAGLKFELKELLNALHKSNTRVVKILSDLGIKNVASLGYEVKTKAYGEIKNEDLAEDNKHTIDSIFNDDVKDLLVRFSESYDRKKLFRDRKKEREARS